MSKVESAVRIMEEPSASQNAHPAVNVAGALAIRPFNRSHIDAMQGWGRHADPLFAAFNVPALSAAERDLYWERGERRPRSSAFAALLDGRLAAHLILRDIDAARACADLGIALDPDLVGRGLGSRIVRLFLVHAFEELRLQRITLDVAAYNRRARRAYEKSGFSVTGSAWLPYDSTLDFRALLAEPSYAWLAEDVRIAGERTAVRFVQMEARAAH